jgi:hypothetical protein
VELAFGTGICNFGTIKNRLKTTGFCIFLMMVCGAACGSLAAAGRRPVVRMVIFKTAVVYSKKSLTVYERVSTP